MNSHLGKRKGNGPGSGRTGRQHLKALWRLENMILEEQSTS